MSDARVAIVTGAARGLGREYAGFFSAEGRRVVLADQDGDGVEAAADAIRAAGGEAIAVRTDVTDVDQTAAMAEAALSAWGRVDILVNNAAVWGDLKPANVTDIDPDYWDFVLGVNLKGPLLCARAVLPAMRQAGWGRIVNVSSMGAYMRGGVYATSKAALNHLTWNLAHEAGDGITVNAVAPGGVHNDATRSQVSDQAFEGLIAGCIVKRAATGADVFAAIRYLTGDDAGYVTGQVLLVNGGFNTRF